MNGISGDITQVEGHLWCFCGRKAIDLPCEDKWRSLHLTSTQDILLLMDDLSASVDMVFSSRVAYRT